MPAPSLSSGLKALLQCLVLVAASAAAAEPPRVAIDVRDFGTIELALDPERAPATVANFLKLVDAGFYDGLMFHRVVANFVIQTGGYTPAFEYREHPETVVNESHNGLANARFTVAMARLDDPDSASAQFFVNVNDNTHLDATATEPGYTVFGRVVAGEDVVVDIELVDTHAVNGMVGVPESPVVVERIRRL